METVTVSEQKEKEPELEKALGELRGHGTQPTFGDQLADSIQEAIEKNPEVLGSLRKFFGKQIIITGFGVGMFDFSVVSLGLYLQSVFGSIGWLPISAGLFVTSVAILRRTMK